MSTEWPYFRDDDDPDNLIYDDGVSDIQKLCHGCGQVRQMDARASHCATCQFHQREGMDIAFRDDDFDDR